MNSIGDLTSIVMWIARIAVIGVFGGVGVVNIVKGKAEEDKKTFNSGFLMLIGAGAVFSATFAIEQAFK